MKIVVIGGTGLIGAKLVSLLGATGHIAVAASPSTGFDAITGVGLARAVAGADVIIDASSPKSFEDDAMLEFARTSTRNLIAAGLAAGVGHHVALSAVGATRLPDSGYLRAKTERERLVEQGGVPFSILRATPFFEFAISIADAATDGDAVRVAPVRIQPILGDDVARITADVATQTPLNGIVEIGGPDEFRFDEFIGLTLAARGDARYVVAESNAQYFGTVLHGSSLVPWDSGARRFGATMFAEWLRRC